MSKRKKRWSYTAGQRPNRVTVFEREHGGMLYAKCWDPSLASNGGGMRKVSLGHRDKALAKAFALEQASKLERGESDLAHGRTSLGELFALYRAERTPRKTPHEQAADDRRIKLWLQLLGEEKDPLKVSLREWEDFIDGRRSGAISSTGEWVTSPEERRPIRDRTIEADLKWLNAVFNWAVRWQDSQGRYLLSENPVRGYPIPKEKNPLRPVMTQDRYKALRNVSDRVTMEVMVGGRLQQVRSCLSELLDLANETGRRLSATLGLRYQDLRLERLPTAPYGAISWPADTDKQGRAWEAVPISAIARAAIDRILRERPGIGEAPLFPAPADPSMPVDRYLADKWLREAERLAGLKPQKGSLWHAFRRKAATELKGAPDKDVMALLGWTDYRSLKAAYQHADPETMLLALESRRELRQANQ